MTNEAKDLKAIERLREADVAASKAYDAEGLAALFTDDAVALGPGQPPVRGIAAIRAGLRRMVASLDIEVLDYKETFEETLLFGDTAVEWGRIEGTERPRGGVEVSTSRVHVMRVLRRFPPGRRGKHRPPYPPAAAQGGPPPPAPARRSRARAPLPQERARRASPAPPARWTAPA